jgi:hypothetical protein
MAFTQQQMASINQAITHDIHPLEQEIYWTQCRQLIQGSKYDVMAYKCQLLEESDTRLKEALIYQSNEQLLLSNELQAVKEKIAASYPSPATPAKNEREWDNPWGTPSKWRNRPLLPDKKQDTKAEPAASHPSPVSPTNKSTPYVNPNGTPTGIRDVEGKQAASYPSPPVSPTPTKGLGQSRFAISYDTPSRSRNSTTSSGIIDDDTPMQGYSTPSNSSDSTFSSIITPDNETMGGCPPDGWNGIEQRDNKSDEVEIDDAPHLPVAAPQQTLTYQQPAPIPQQTGGPLQQIHLHQQAAPVHQPASAPQSTQPDRVASVSKTLKRKSDPLAGDRTDDGDGEAAPTVAKKIKTIPSPQEPSPERSSLSSMGTKKPKTAALSWSDLPEHAPFGSPTSINVPLILGLEKNHQSINAAGTATENANVAFSPLTNETTPTQLVPSPMPSVSDSPMLSDSLMASDSPTAISDQDASVAPFTPVPPVAPAPPLQSATASSVAESPPSSTENTDEMVERITASMDGLATTVAADKAESSSGVEHTTSKKKKGLKKDAMSMLALKLQGRKDTADLRQNSVQQQVETNHGHLIGPEHSSSHGAASPMQDETSHAEGAIAQPSHGPYWTEGQPIIPDELVYLTPHQQSCYENECAIRESLNQPMPPRCIFLRKDEYEPVPDITNEPEDESDKRDENGRTAKGRGKMRATDGKVPLSKSKSYGLRYEGDEGDEDDMDYHAAVAQSRSMHAARPHQNGSSSSSSASAASNLPATDDKVPPRTKSKPAGWSDEDFEAIEAELLADALARSKKEAMSHQIGSSSSAGASAANNQIGMRSIGNSYAGETESDSPDDYEDWNKQEDDEGYGGVEEDDKGRGGGVEEDEDADDEEDDGEYNGRFKGDDEDSGYNSSRHSSSGNRQKKEDDAVNHLTSRLEMAGIGSDRRNDSRRGRRTHRSNGENVLRSTEEVEGEEEVLNEQSSPLNERRERERGPSPEDRVKDDLAREMAKAEITSQDTA